MSRVETGVLEVTRPVPLEEVAVLSPLPQRPTDQVDVQVPRSSRRYWPTLCCSSGLPTPSNAPAAGRSTGADRGGPCRRPHRLRHRPWPRVRPADRSASSSRSSASATGPTGSAWSRPRGPGFTDAMDGELSLDDTPGGGLPR
jgi:hypothetical protein